MEDSSVKRVMQTAGASALALFLAAPMFAQSRGYERRDGNRSDRGRSERTERSNRNDRNDRNDRSNGSQRSYRENDRVTVRGHVSSFSRERDGYRVHIDGGHGSYWVPQSYFRNRGPRVGVSIVLGGIWRSGSVYVDDVNWPDDGYYNDGYGYSDGYVRGYVERVDSRRGTVEMRDDRSGRMILVAFRAEARYDRLGFNDIRRGDVIEVSGSWARGNVFEAYDITSIRDGRR